MGDLLISIHLVIDFQTIKTIDLVTDTVIYIFMHINNHMMIYIVMSNIWLIWYIDTFNWRSFRALKYEPDYKKKVDIAKYFAVYGVKAYSMVVRLLGLLQSIFSKPFPNFLDYKTTETYINI